MFHQVRSGDATNAAMQSAQQQAQRPAAPRTILEVGAGIGAFTPLFKGFASVSDSYFATDIGQNGAQSPYFADLRDPQDSTQSKIPGVRILDQVDANQLGQRFAANSVDQIIGANAYGDIDTPGASYGLMASTGDAQQAFQVDTRFARSAHEVLKPGGQVRLFGRCNTMHSFLKDAWGARERIKPKQVNKFMDIPAKELQKIAAIGFDVDVYPAVQPDHIEGRRPDTHAASIGQAGEGRKVLGQYNTEFVLTKTANGSAGSVVLHTEEDAIAAEISQTYDEYAQSLSDTAQTRQSTETDTLNAQNSVDDFEAQLLAEQDALLFGNGAFRDAPR